MLRGGRGLPVVIVKVNFLRGVDSERVVFLEFIRVGCGVGGPSVLNKAFVGPRR
jgi:hypothetical protein